MHMNDTKVTMRDVAAKLGVSVATVHRALTDKDCVSEDTLRVVKQAARDMGYHANKLAPGLKDSSKKIAVIVRNVFPDFNNMLVDGIMRAKNELAEYNVFGELIILDRENYNNTLKEQLYKISESDFDGVIFYIARLGGRTDIEQAVRTLKQKGIKIVSIYNDEGISEDIEAVVMPDAFRAGSIAAELLSISGLKRGDGIGIFAGDKSFQLHNDYINGFLSKNEDYGFEILDIVEHRDNSDIAYYSTEQFLKDNPEVKGFYCSTAVTAPICRCAYELGYLGRLKIIGTDITSGTLPFMENGMLTAMLFQDTFRVGYKAYKRIYEAISDLESVNTDKCIKINPQIVIKANLDFYSRFLDSSNRVRGDSAE